MTTPSGGRPMRLTSTGRRLLATVSSTTKMDAGLWVHLDGARDRVLRGGDIPHRHGDGDGQHEVELALAPQQPHSLRLRAHCQNSGTRTGTGTWSAGTRNGAARTWGPMRPSRLTLSSSSVSPRLIRPSRARDSDPVSSETTTATASVSSVTPIAAR